uniref:Serum response factor-binding protein 1 n=1 Tax=Amphimedon queenslandica TaxID=400682 RepID=A0A1X7UNR3_AMPQE
MDASERSKDEVLLKRGLKRAKLFQIQKLTKNIRLYKNKRGSEEQLEKNRRKSERFAQDLETIKDIDITKLSKLLLSKDEDISSILTTKEMPVDVTKRAQWRLLHTKVMKETCLTSLFENPSPVTDKPEELSQMEDTDSEEIEEEMNKGTLNVDSSEEHDNNSITEESSDDSHKKQKKVLPHQVQTLFVESLSKSNKDTRRMSSTKQVKFIKQKSVKKNRMGQRQRRLMWESLYGAGAKHLKDATTVRKKKRGSKFL